jgi:branched-chain amino acid transport system substrate-binding protein
MIRHFRTHVGVMITVLVLAVTPVLAAGKPPVKIGLLYGLRGLAGAYSRGIIIGHNIAAEEINARGGILGGRKIQYVIRDTRLKPEVAIQEFRRLVLQDQVDFVMGVISSRVALAVSQVAKEMQVLFVDNAAQTAALTGEQGHRYVARTTSNSTIIGRTAALAAAKQPWQTYYFIGPDYEWGHMVNNDFWTFLQTKKAGVIKLGEMWPRLGSRDFSGFISALINAKPDAVFSSMWGGDLLAFLKQAKAQGLFEATHFISPAASDLNILQPMAGNMPDGILTTFGYAFDWFPVQEKENQQFIAKFKKRAGSEPKTPDVYGYVGTYILAEAIERAGTTETEALIDTLRGGTFATLMGDVTMRDFDGQATFSYNAGYTYTNGSYPFKRLRDIIRVDGNAVLQTWEEIQQARLKYQARIR